MFIAPGNAGTKLHGTNVDLNLDNFAGIKQFVLVNNINLVVVGPEEPLVKGIQDFFSHDDEIAFVPIVGPASEAARLEGSKEFAKSFMSRHAIPTAAYRSFGKENLSDGYAFLESLKPPYVLKADGLAAGKGVLILSSLEEAKAELAQMLDGKFGKASQKVVVEEFLSGIEVSVFVATDGTTYKILPEAKDYKRIGEGDTGPNTGGMGAVSPVPFVTPDFMDKVRTRIIEPTIHGLKKDNIIYKGFIFIGLMNVNGEPYVIEYNVRMGDPETEVVLMRIESDIIDIFEGVIYGTLNKKELKIDPRTAATVVCVSDGYPGKYEKNKPITGLDKASQSIIFHAGTATEGNKTVTSGGRVLAVTSLGDTLAQAIEKSYETISGIHYDGIYFRKDIGQDLLK